MHKYFLILILVMPDMMVRIVSTWTCYMYMRHIKQQNFAYNTKYTRAFSHGRLQVANERDIFLVTRPVPGTCTKSNCTKVYYQR
jgi:hypothetical protein